MAGRGKAAIAAVMTVGALGFGCAASLPLQNYDKVSLGMTADQVLAVAGKPNKQFLMESTGEGTLLPTPAGKSETWFYKTGLIQFHDGKVVAKGEKVEYPPSPSQ
jgi:hypothetical protein